MFIAIRRASSSVLLTSNHFMFSVCSNPAANQNFKPRPTRALTMLRLISFGEPICTYSTRLSLIDARADAHENRQRASGRAGDAPVKAGISVYSPSHVAQKGAVLDQNPYRGADKPATNRRFCEQRGTAMGCWSGARR
jgi:hypothetical protein